MKNKVIKILLTYMIISILFGCTNKPQNINEIKKENILYDESIFFFEQPPEIEIAGDNSNIEIFNWDEKSVKFEIFKKIRKVNSSEEKLKLDYEKFNITTEHNKNKVSFNFKYKGDMDNPLDQSLDLKIYIPKKVRCIKLKLENGKIRIHDDINCNILTDLSMVNMEIKNMKGLLCYKGDKSNIKISGGVIYDGSFICVNIGNIDVKLQCQEGGNYNFYTKNGNIDLNMPETSKFALDSMGYIQVNEFECGEYPTKIKVETDMGRICINKY